MDSNFQNLLYKWPRVVIKDTDIGTVFHNRPGARHSAVKRMLRKKTLLKVRRGMYLIGKPFVKEPPNPNEIAQMIYGPSYISFESALSYHQLIPEAVYATTSATAKRGKIFNTALGVFRYTHIPVKKFYLGVLRVETKQGAFLMAEPWKAIADLCYARRKTWKNLRGLELDLRIEHDNLEESNRELLKDLANRYPSRHVQHILQMMVKELQ
ncbi:MAG: hypothetical protein WB791_05495 [Waddliaceae bacterium]